MKILIRVVDDWGEFYVDGEFVYDGEWLENSVIMGFIQALRDVMDIELRFFEGHSTAQLTKDGKVEAVDIPLYIMNEKNYWSDWDEAEIVPKIKEEEDES